MLRPKLNRIWGGSTASTRRDPGDTKYIQGWISEIPTFQVLNYLQYKMDTTMLAQAERGFFEWGNDVTYAKGAIAWDELDKKIYISQVAGPSKTLAPSNNTAQWKVSSIQITRQEYDALNASITAHIADVTGNPHKLTAGRLDSYTKSETDALITQYRALVSAHVNDKNNPHATTAAQVGAVPVTGGTYTDDVIFETGRVLLDSAASNKVGLLSGAGVFLQSGTGVLGISSTGVAVAGTASSLSNIITEKTFADQKAAVEPDYAIPMPVWYQPLLGDLNLYQGNGAVVTAPTTYNAQYDASGRYMFGKTVGVAENINMVSPYTSPCVGSDIATVAVDFMYGSVSTADTSEPYSCGPGGTGGRVKPYFRSNGAIAMRSSSQVLVSPLTYADGKLHRVVGVKTATRLELYIDGVFISGINGANGAIINGAIINTSANTTAAQNVDLSICNLRVWDVALTAKQVSNL